MHKIRRAELFAAAAHTAVGQFRKYTGEPYYVHPREVAAIVQAAGGDDAQVMAAHLHDVVEDTAITLEQIRFFFDGDVAALVEDLTDVSLPADGNRAERKAIDREHTAQASLRAKMIKLADVISNTRSIREHDQKFAKVYLEEMRLLLSEALHDADPELLSCAWKQIGQE